MVKVTQLRGHRGAKCFFFQMGGCLQPCSYHPARRFVYQHLFKFPASSFPSRSPFSAPVCSVSFPFSIRPSSLSLLASLTHSLSVSPSPAHPRVCLLPTGPSPTESGHLEVPGDGRPRHPSPSALWLRQEGWAKGRGGRHSSQTGTGAQLGLGKKRGNKELGDRGCGCQGGKGCAGVEVGATPGFVGRSGAEPGLRPEKEWAPHDKEPQ